MREPGTRKRPERSWSRRKTGFRRKAEEGYLRRSENPPALAVGSVKVIYDARDAQRVAAIARSRGVKTSEVYREALAYYLAAQA